MLSLAGLESRITFEPATRDTAAGTWLERWKHWGGCGPLNLKTSCRKMVSLLVLSWANSQYQKLLATLCRESRRRPAAPTGVATDLLHVPEDLAHVCFVANRAQWSRRIHFEPRMRVEKEYLLGGRTWTCLACGRRTDQSITVRPLYDGNRQSSCFVVHGDSVDLVLL